MKLVLIARALDVILLGQLGAEIATGQQARRAQPSCRGPFPRDGAFREIQILGDVRNLSDRQQLCAPSDAALPTLCSRYEAGSEPASQTAAPWDGEGDRREDRGRNGYC